MFKEDVVGVAGGGAGGGIGHVPATVVGVGRHLRHSGPEKGFGFVLELFGKIDRTRDSGGVFDIYSQAINVTSRDGVGGCLDRAAGGEARIGAVFTV